MRVEYTKDSWHLKRARGKTIRITLEFSQQHFFLLEGEKEDKEKYLKETVTGSICLTDNKSKHVSTQGPS